MPKKKKKEMPVEIWESNAIKQAIEETVDYIFESLMTFHDIFAKEGTIPNGDGKDNLVQDILSTILSEQHERVITARKPVFGTDDICQIIKTHVEDEVSDNDDDDFFQGDRPRKKKKRSSSRRNRWNKLFQDFMEECEEEEVLDQCPSEFTDIYEDIVE